MSQDRSTHGSGSSQNPRGRGSSDRRGPSNRRGAATDRPGAPGDRRGGPGERGARSGDRRGRENRDGAASTGSRRNAKGHERNRRAQHERAYSEQAPGQRRRQSDPARLAAFRALRAVTSEDAYGNLVLPALVRELRLDRRDAAFATELGYGAMRFSGTWDAVLAECVDRPLEQLDPAVLDALRLGTHQLLAMRVPDHAALDATVGLVRGEIGQGPAGLVNAVLRKVARRSQEEWFEALEAEQPDRWRRMGIRHAHPVWEIRALRRALRANGRDPEEITALLEADNEAPRVHLVALPGLGSLDGALEAGAEPGDLVPGSAVSGGGDVHRVPGTREGVVRVQDAGSQLVARVLAAADVTEDSGRWADLCAGPGGKAALLAALAHERGAHLLANEVSEHRGELVRQSLQPVPRDAWEVRTGDAREVPGWHPGGFDRVLVDVPCTGLGALRRRPEARWRRTPSDVADLATVQRELLRAAVDATRPGGVVLYATCSPHTAETHDVLHDLLDERTDVTVLDTADLAARAALPGALDGDRAVRHEVPGGGTSVQLWPHVHGTDAMYMVALRRTA
ncbi:RsmB/NOP family class I SAM-dependent RNA methyltransferase [Kocuria rhizophila]|uniref:RsmB/NOP family class I SAM-dependent RNA methyltransferase n=1 Tax=Kocuria rhizophila TaxID=72000 RepID=UPI00190CEDB3|nr:RsmB/NOP family class I SAM-dependent RNA methyltransferase [Kocuria rhizophila]MBK4120032.1 rRNA small subunit methyltransferase B [Kocuria rhizophila]